MVTKQQPQFKTLNNVKDGNETKPRPQFKTLDNVKDRHEAKIETAI